MAKIKLIILLPYIRSLSSVTIGRFKFNGVDDLKNEPDDIKEDLIKIISFFRQKESRGLDSLVYMILEVPGEELPETLLELGKNFEILKFICFSPEGRSLAVEHLTPYIFSPDNKNPYKVDTNKNVYLYKVSEGFSPQSQHVSYPHGSDRPPFYQNITSEALPNIEEPMFNVLLENISIEDLRAIYWYNKTFSIHGSDQREELLRISSAFESHLSVDLNNEMANKETKEILSEFVSIDKVNECLKKLKPLLSEKIVNQLSDQITHKTGSVNITKWFKGHFYSVGSGIRHGSEVSDLAEPVVSKTKAKKRRSIYYAGESSHEFLNSVYFGKKLFKFIIEDKYLPYEEHLRMLRIERLEQLLVSDEDRLRILKEQISKKEIGKLEPEDILISFSFTRSYYGNKAMVYKILMRLLLELKASDPEVWKEIKTFAEKILEKELSEEDIKDYRVFGSYIHALIDIDSIFHEYKFQVRNFNNFERNRFYIGQYIAYATNTLL